MVGQPSSSVVMGMAFVSVVEIGFPDQISGPPRGCKSAAISVAMLRARIEGQSGVPPFWAWNASSNGQFFYLVADCVREARAVAPRAPWSLRMRVHEFMAAAQ